MGRRWSPGERAGARGGLSGSARQNVVGYGSWAPVGTHRGPARTGERAGLREPSVRRVPACPAEASPNRPLYRRRITLCPVAESPVENSRASVPVRRQASGQDGES